LRRRSLRPPSTLVEARRRSSPGADDDRYEPFLIAVGAILKFATHFHIAGVDLHTVEVILMLVGAFGPVLSLFLLTRGRSTDGPVVPPV
jgi:hypothetical protein